MMEEGLKCAMDIQKAIAEEAKSLINENRMRDNGTFYHTQFKIKHDIFRQPAVLRRLALW